MWIEENVVIILTLFYFRLHKIYLQVVLRELNLHKKFSTLGAYI